MTSDRQLDDNVQQQQQQQQMQVQEIDDAWEARKAQPAQNDGLSRAQPIQQPNQ